MIMKEGRLTEELKASIIQIINKWVKLPHYRVFIFGSRANGKAGERSDIDVGIEAPEAVPGHIKIEIEDELSDLPIMQKIDFVDFKNVSDDFREVARQKIEVIYEK